MRTIHRLLCRIGVHHWTFQSDPETGATYQQCDRCRRERDTIALADSPGGG